MNKIIIKSNPSKLPNKMHFDIQRNTRMQIIKPKKGKGSYNRKSMKIDY